MAVDAATANDTKPRKPLLLLGLHWIIIINFVFECAYSAFIIFVVLAPEGGGGPLFGQADSIPHELLEKRRMYASEFWIAMGGLCVYLALTEIGPRLRRYRGW